jgi:hypothetical protein
MIKAFIAWLHRITAPPVEVEVMVGDVWVHTGDDPWAVGCFVLAVADGWVQFRDADDDIHALKCNRFCRGMELKSRPELSPSPPSH